jgi:hypothetical protein
VTTTFQNQTGHPYGDGPLQVALGFNYDKQISDKWSILLTTDAQGTSSGYDILGQPGTRTHAHILMNASLKLYDHDHKWEVAVIGTNLTDALYADPYGNKPLGNVGDLTAYLHPPREVTLQVTRHF